MKNFRIKYNPYLVTTEVLVDGKKPKSNSSLNFSTIRLQEWVGKLPEIISKEYNDRNIDCLEFIGTTADFEDLKISFDSQRDDRVSVVKFKHKKTADISDVEKTVNEIFTEIQQGPVDDLKHPSIIDAFEKAKNQEFEVNVVATMSSGKSTLINALLGFELLPSKQEACTATIVRITDTNQKGFSAITYNHQGEKLQKMENVTVDDMRVLNDDANVSTIEIKGRIPFVSSVGMKLVIIDTPGPNNSRDERHKETTYKMLANSDKSLVLYVMNATTLGITDDKYFLDYVCECMKSGGKQSRDRFIFAVNKINLFKIKQDGLDGIEKALLATKKDLEYRNIFSPNIFPVAALPALELRTEEEECETLPQFKMKSEKYPCMHFDNYYHFSNLPDIIKSKVDNLLLDSNEDQKTEIHTGIVSIEMAISQYVNKYARTTKIYDLVHSFNAKLDEVAAIANIEEAIRNDESKKEGLQNQITYIKENISNAYGAKTVSKKVDKLNLKADIDQETKDITDVILNRINGLLSNHSNKVKKDKALKDFRDIEKNCKDILCELNVRIQNTLSKSFNDAFNDIIEDYKSYIQDLNVNLDASVLSLNPLTLVEANLKNISLIVNDNATIVGETYTDTVTEEYEVWVEDTVYLLLPWTWFNEGDHWETRTREVEKEFTKEVEYVDMKKVANKYSVPIQSHIQNAKSSISKYVENETNRIKKHLKSHLEKIDKELEKKIDALSTTINMNNETVQEIERKQENLKWLIKIQKKVNNIINF